MPKVKNDKTKLVGLCYECSCVSIRTTERRNRRASELEKQLEILLRNVCRILGSKIQIDEHEERGNRSLYAQTPT